MKEKNMLCCFWITAENLTQDYLVPLSLQSLCLHNYAVIIKTDLDNKLDIEYISKNIKYIVYISAISETAEMN